MVVRNEGFGKLRANYLFTEIAQRKQSYLKANPAAELIALGIGDTTEPLTSSCVAAIRAKAEAMGVTKTYCGYPDFNGSQELRSLISEHHYHGKVTASEIFVSDGSKPDLARMQLLFGHGTRVAVMDPVYPAYVDGTVITCKGGDVTASGGYGRIAYLPCNPSNGFWPDLESHREKLNETDVFFVCSPANPTGTVATRQNLEDLVKYAKACDFLVVFDAAYSEFIQSDSDLPRSIYEIEGAAAVAIETNSFSKSLGFTGVRLGWTVCHKEVLKYSCQTPIYPDWCRMAGTFFNGPSTLAEAAGIGCLATATARAETSALRADYMMNAKLLKDAMTEAGFSCYGGEHCPYVWVQTKKMANGTRQSSWELFEEFLQRAQLLVTPGVGFGQEGSSFIRISAFAHRSSVLEAVRRIADTFGSSTIVN